MKKPVVLVVLGTRPEAVKLAPVVRALRREKSLACRLLSTGQHRATLDGALADFRLRPDADLRLFRRGQTLAAFTARALKKLPPAVRAFSPSLVVVQGDTTTALCGALAAFQEGVPIAHVEAGLRSGNLAQPFPEEANRVLIDKLAALLFAPTPAAAQNLARAAGKVVVTGNTGVDALRWGLARRRAVENPGLRRLLRGLRPGEPLILATMHRRESLDGRLRRALGAVAGLLDDFPPARLVFPAHLNPKVLAAARAALSRPRALLLPPLSYGDMLAALKKARLVMTDSGGLQEEAAFLGKPTLVLREVTDRPEAETAGVAKVAGLDPARIRRLARRLLREGPDYRRMARRARVFGDGRAGKRVAAEIARFLRANPASRRG